VTTVADTWILEPAEPTWSAPDPPDPDVSGTEHDFGLAERPFSPVPDFRFIYQCTSWRQALDGITEAMERRESVVVLTGVEGVGKTMLCRALLDHLPPRTFVSLILNPRLTGEELVAQILSDFGVIRTATDPGAGGGDVSSHQLVTALDRFLVSLAPLSAAAVVVIDEAHHLSPQVLEHLRLLSNLGRGSALSLQIVLIGQPGLNDMLSQGDVSPFAQRVSRRMELQPFSTSEVGEYVNHRLLAAYGVAAAPRSARTELRLFGDSSDLESWHVRFTPWALRVVALLAGGVPRAVNALCDRALEVAYHRGHQTIGTRIVFAAAKQLKPHRLPHTWLPLSRVAGVAAVLMLLIAGPATWAAWRTPSAAAPDTTSRLLTANVLTGTLEVRDGIRVEVARFRNERRASAVAAQIEEAGLPAFTRTSDDGIWHHTAVGPFVSADDAAAAQKTLSALGFSRTRLEAEP